MAFRTDLQQLCSCLLGCLPHSLCHRVLELAGGHLPLVAVIIVNPGVPVQPRLQQRQATLGLITLGCTFSQLL